MDSSTVTINKDSQDHSATFDKITFYEEGEYVFTVTEEDNGIDGVTYDGPKTITFEAVDENKDGNLTVSVSGDNVAEGVVTFTNEYNLSSATLDIDLTKTITGKAWQADDSFDFTLEAKDEVTKAAIEAGSIVMPENTTVTITSDTADHKALFDKITFKKEGTYTFTVSEGDTGIENWQDVASQDIVITVTDDDHGQLIVENLTPANTVNASTSLTFENVWTPTPVSVAIQGIKQMNGRDLLGTDVFEFVITANKENSPMPAQTTVNNNGEDINFGSLTFNQTGTYEYTITENISEELKGMGVEHDGASQVTVTVNITDDDNDGVFKSSLTYSQSVENDTSKFLFKNKYEADPVTIGETVTTGVVANKVVENVDPDNQYTLDANDFSFTLVKGNNKDSDPIKEAETVLTNGQDGSFVVIPADTEYTEVGTYVYTLKENATSIPGITVDSKVYTITVDITDEGFDGKLDAKVTITVGDTPADAIVFTNKFDALSVSPTEELVGTKVLNGKPLANNEFEFEFKAADPAYATTVNGADAEGKVVVTNYSGVVDKNIKFPSLTFDKEGVYSYTISEVNAGKYGFTYDTSVYTVTYTVELNENNALEVVSTTITKGDTPADAIVFTNSYDPDPAVVSEGTGNAISVNKTLTGRDLKAEEFTFDLYWVEGDKEVLIGTATNDADGNVVFGPVEHASTGVWNYVVKERGAGNTVDGITYDASVVDVTVKVTDEGYDGKLDATVEYSQDRTFENSYEAKDVTDVILPVKKELANRELRDGEFSFELYQDGKLIDTTTNDVNGDVRFKGLTFTGADQTVTYTVKEVKGADKTVTYDDTVYEIKVSVTDNLKGQLEAKVEVVNDKDGDNVATFSNTYTEPEILVPDTSDNNITLLVSIAAACATGLMITLVLKRKIRHN